MNDWADEWLLTELTKKIQLAEDLGHQLLNWARTARERTPVAFIGAGMSFNARPKARYRELGFRGTGTPRAFSWRELSERFRSELKSYGEDGESDALWLAELYEQAFGPEALMRVIREAVPDELLDPGEAHTALYEIGWQAILTTNYDTLVERAWKTTHAPGRIQTCFTDADLVRSAGQEMALEIIHLHGILSRPETIVLTLEQYRRYPERSPGLLTKVRQLFLQHPMLLIGFSATDPNFIQWNGWISDLVGSQKNPWISLSVGATPGVARRSYWKGALTFIPVTPDQLTGILRALGKYLRDDFGRDETIPIALERVSQAQSIDSLVRTLPSLLAIQRMPIHRGGDSRKRKIFTEAVKRAFEIRHGESAAKSAWELLNRPTSRTGSGTTQPTDAEDARHLVRETLGREWPLWLVHGTNHLGLRIRIRRTVFTVTDEESKLPADTQPEIHRALKLAILEQEIQNGGAGSDALAQALQSETSLSAEERNRLEGLRQLRNLRSGLPVTPSNDILDAQALRRIGFIASLSGQNEKAFGAFSQAAVLSRDESEPELIEWITIRSAMYAELLVGGERSHGKQSIKSEQPEARLRWLESKIETIREFRALETMARDELIAQLATNDTEKSEFLPRSCSKLLSLLEGVWAHPLLTANAAELHGHAQWKAGNRVESVRALSRYGSRKLEMLLGKHQESPNRPPLESSLIDALLLEGRWFPEWIARTEALTHIVSEIECSRLEKLWPWILDAARSISGDDVFRGGSPATCSEALDSLAELIIVRWSMLRPQIFLDEWSVLSAATQVELIQLKIKVAIEINQLPFSDWIEVSALSTEDFDQSVATALSLLEVNDESWSELIRSLLDSFDYIDFAQSRIPVDGKAAAMIGRWLAEPYLHETFFATRLRSAWTHILRPRDFSSIGAFAKLAIGALAGKQPKADIVDSIRTLGDSLEGLTNAEILEIPGLLARLLSEVSTEAEDSLSKALRAHAIAYVARRLLGVGSNALASRCEDILVTTLNSSSFAVLQAASIPIQLSERFRTTLYDRIVTTLTRTRVTGGVNMRIVAILAAYEVISRNESEPLSAEWTFFACLLARDEDSEVAAASLELISRAFSMQRLSAAMAGMLEQCADALLDAALDPRASIVGLAAFWLSRLHSRNRMPASRAAKVAEVLHRLESDHRAAIVTYLWMAKQQDEASSHMPSPT